MATPNWCMILPFLGAKRCKAFLSPTLWWTPPAIFRSCPLISLILPGASLHRRDFAPREPRIWGRILGCELLSPEFWGRIPGSNFLVLCFPIKRAPSKIHPQEIHRPKFTCKKITPEFGLKNSHFTSAAPFC